MCKRIPAAIALALACVPLALLTAQPALAQTTQSAPETPSAMAAGARSITWTEPELNDALAKRFPQQRNLHGLLQVTLSQPHVQLVPSANRLRTSACAWPSPSPARPMRATCSCCTACALSPVTARCA